MTRSFTLRFMHILGFKYACFLSLQWMNSGQIWRQQNAFKHLLVDSHAVRSKAVVLLLLIHCLLTLPLYESLYLFCYAVHSALYNVAFILGTKRERCLFTLFVFLMSVSDCKCYVSRPHDAMGWSTKYDCGIS